MRHGAHGHGSPRLSAPTRAWVNAVGLGVWATGAGWLALHHFGTHAGEFGPERSPFEPWWLKAHGALAFLSLWTCGLLWGQHIVKAWSRHQRRWSGGIVLGTLLVLILTGYLLYYAGADSREVASVVHWVLGLALPLAYLSHRLIHRAGPVRRPHLAEPLQGGRPAQHRAHGT